MLRVGLLENLRRLASQMSETWDEHRRADAWVTPLLDAGKANQPLPEPEPLDRPGDPFVVRCLQVLRAEGQPEAIDKVKARLASLGVDVNEAVRRENQRQAVNQVSVGNCVTSLRLARRPRLGRFLREHQRRRGASCAKIPPASIRVRTSPPATATAR